MDYQNLLIRLEQSNDVLNIEAAKAVRALIRENNALYEGYDGMYRELQRQKRIMAEEREKRK